MDTSAPPLESLEARAVAAYHAATLEAQAEDERRRAATDERHIARATEAVARAFGPDALDMDPTVATVAGRPAIVLHVAGARLATEPELPAAIRGLIACPLCAAWDCRTDARLTGLADLGRFLEAPRTFELVAHEGTHGGLCNGREEREPVRRLRPYRVLMAGDAEDIEDAMNELADQGYEPSVVPGADELAIVLGRATRVFTDDDEPF